MKKPFRFAVLRLTLPGLGAAVFLGLFQAAAQEKAPDPAELAVCVVKAGEATSRLAFDPTSAFDGETIRLPLDTRQITFALQFPAKSIPPFLRVSPADGGVINGRHLGLKLPVDASSGQAGFTLDTTGDPGLYRVVVDVPPQRMVFSVWLGAGLRDAPAEPAGIPAPPPVAAPAVPLADLLKRLPKSLPDAAQKPAARFIPSAPPVAPSKPARE